MGDERLNDLMVLNVEKEDNNINLEEAVDIFAKLKKSMISAYLNKNLFFLALCFFQNYNNHENK